MCCVSASCSALVSVLRGPSWGFQVATERGSPRFIIQRVGVKLLVFSRWSRPRTVRVKESKTRLVLESAAPSTYHVRWIHNSLQPGFVLFTTFSQGKIPGLFQGCVAFTRSSLHHPLKPQIPTFLLQCLRLAHSLTTGKLQKYPTLAYTKPVNSVFRALWLVPYLGIFWEF